MKFNVEKWLLSKGEDIRQYTEGVIRQTTKDGKKVFCLFSKKSNRNLGCFKTRKEAENREREVQFFKSQGVHSLDKYKNTVASHDSPNLLLELEDVKILKPEEIDDDKLAKAGLKRNKDLLYVRFKLCHEGANKNKDFFDKEELRENFDTALFKPINWEHNKQQILGCIYDAQFVDPSDDDQADANNSKAFVLCDAVIYKYQFPVKAQIIKERFDQNRLKFSMETWFEKAQCSECDSSFESHSDYCDHLKNRTTASSTTNRILRGITFGAAGIVKRPADIDAVGLAVAREHLSEETIQFIVNDIGTFENMESILDGFISKLRSDELVDEEKVNDKLKMMMSKFVSVEDMNNMNASKGGSIVDNKTYTEEQVQAKVEKAIEQYKSQMDIEGKVAEAEEKVEAKNQEIEDLKQQLETANKKAEKVEEELNSYKTSIEKEKLVASRIKELEDGNVEFSDEKKETLVKQVAEMSDETFALFRDSLIEAASKNAEGANEDDDDEDEEDEDENNSNASKHGKKEDKKKKKENRSSASMPNIPNEETQSKVAGIGDLLKKFSGEEEQNK